MKLSFDKFERYELPQVTLCNPNSRAIEVDGKITITDTVGVLSNPKGMNLKLNFNAPHELSFDYYRHKGADPIGMPTEYIVEILNQSNQLIKQVDTFLSYDEAEQCVEKFDLSTLNDGEYLNIIKQSFYDSIYESIQTDRYIYLTDIGYFIISSVTDSDEDNIDKKSISCKSCEENEFAIAEGLYLKEGTYYLHTDNNDGLLDLFLPKTVGWTIGFIDPSLLNKPYFVEETEVDNGYNFLYTTIQDMFECIVEPDIIKRTVSVYSRVYYAEHHLTDIHIAKYNLLKHKTVEENDEDKYTALNVQGKDENLEIRTVNPTGKNIIYNFESRFALMSKQLQEAIIKWQEKCESVEEEYLSLQQSYYEELDELFNEEQDIKVLEGQLKELNATLEAAKTMAGSDTKNQSVKNVKTAIKNKQLEIDEKTEKYNVHKTEVEEIYTKYIDQINLHCAIGIDAEDIWCNKIFTGDLLNELMTHIKPTEYVDEYMLVTDSMTYPERFEKSKELMDRAQSQLVKISSGKKIYSIDTRSFLFNKQFKHFSEQLCAGAIIYVETKNDTMEQLHLTGIDINFDDKSTNFTLGNKYDRSDLKALYDEALGKNSKSFNELKYVQSLIEDQQKDLTNQKKLVNQILNLTLDNVITSDNQSIEINSYGLLGRRNILNEDGTFKKDDNGNLLFDPEQIRLVNNTIVFTEENWQTASTAIGKIIVGTESDGVTPIYSYGVVGQTIIGELILGNNLVLTGTGAGIKIKDSEGNDAFYADNDGNLVLSGTIHARGGTLGGWKIIGARMCSESPFADINGNDLYTILKGTGDVAFATMAPGTGSTTGATSQILHNGKARFGRHIQNMTDAADTAYSLVVDISGTSIYNDMRVYCEAAFDKRIITSSIQANGTIYPQNGINIEGGALRIESGNDSVFNALIRPMKDAGDVDVGTPTYKWANIYAKTGTIQTSDKNVKKNILKLTDVHKQFFMKLVPVSFTFVDGTSGRTHIGFISQDVEQAMQELGMTSLDFAGFCKDVKTKIETTESGSEIEVPDLDENGNQKYLYALRYEEFIGIISYVLQDTICKLNGIEERLIKVENK